jgi:hypothetical protein
MSIESMKRYVLARIKPGDVRKMYINGHERDAVVAGVYPHHVSVLYQTWSPLQRTWVRTSYTWYDMMILLGGIRKHVN